MRVGTWLDRVRKLKVKARAARAARKRQRRPEVMMRKVKAASRRAARKAAEHPETASRDAYFERHPERCS